MVELLVSMAITILIITMIVTITSIALDAWRDSRNEIRASRQAKALLDVLSKDLESMVIRSGNNYEWFNAKAGIPAGDIPSSSIASLIFFTAATDRYDGNIGGTEDKGGDVSTVGYSMVIQNPITGTSGDFNTFAMYRQLENPDVTFNSYLAKPETPGGPGLATSFGTIKTDGSNFICENIRELSIVFLIEYVDTNGTRQQVRIPVLANGGGKSVKEFKIMGSGLQTDVTDPVFANGRLLSADVSISVISDHGLGILRATGDPNLAEANSYHYSTTVRLPQP